MNPMTTMSLSSSLNTLLLESPASQLLWGFVIRMIEAKEKCR